MLDTVIKAAMNMIVKGSLVRQQVLGVHLRSDYCVSVSSEVNLLHLGENGLKYRILKRGKEMESSVGDDKLSPTEKALKL